MSRIIARYQFLRVTSIRELTFQGTALESHAKLLAANGYYWQRNGTSCYNCGFSMELDLNPELSMRGHTDYCQHNKHLEPSLEILANGENYLAGFVAEKDIHDLYPRDNLWVTLALKYSIEYPPHLISESKLHTIGGLTINGNPIRDIMSNTLTPIGSQTLMLEPSTYYCLLRREETRYETFKNIFYPWRHQELNTKLIAKHGFFFTFVEDVVSCFVCRVCIGGLKGDIDIVDLYRNFSPLCPLLH